jgi:murein DD-endopeptidase MepM/ murein hydrolase activator NlpD
VKYQTRLREKPLEFLSEFGSRQTACVISSGGGRSCARCGSCSACENRVRAAAPRQLVNAPGELLFNSSRRQQLSADTLAAYQRLYQAARTAAIASPFLKIISGYRDYDRQASLWKQRLLTKLRSLGCEDASLGCAGAAIDRTNQALRLLPLPHPRDAWVNRFVQELQRGTCALRCDPRHAVRELSVGTAPPGASAHHTGRAVDVFVGRAQGFSDALSRNPRNVQWQRSQPSYQWLVCNAARFGFHPYNAEPWHWEYTASDEASTNVFSEFDYQLGAQTPVGVRQSSSPCPETGNRSPYLIERGRRGRVFSRRRLRQPNGVSILTNRIHAALDVPAPIGTPVYAVLDGKVIFSGLKAGFGNLVILYHARPPHTSSAGSVPVTTAYGHLNYRAVQKGDCVKAGQRLGLSGNTFRDSANRSSFGDRDYFQPHLHFSVQLLRADRNRIRFLDPRRGFPDSREPDDIGLDGANEGFGSHYEEDWRRRVHPVDWLRDLGVGIAAASLPAPAARPTQPQQPRRTVRAPASAQEFEFLENER